MTKRLDDLIDSTDSDSEKSVLKETLKNVTNTHANVEKSSIVDLNG